MEPKERGHAFALCKYKIKIYWNIPTKTRGFKYKKKIPQDWFSRNVRPNQEWTLIYHLIEHRTKRKLIQNFVVAARRQVILFVTVVTGNAKMIEIK